MSCSWAEAGRVKVAGKALPNEKGKLQVGTPQQHPQGDICEAVSYWIAPTGWAFYTKMAQEFLIASFFSRVPLCECRVLVNIYFNFGPARKIGHWNIVLFLSTSCMVVSDDVYKYQSTLHGGFCSSHGFQFLRSNESMNQWISELVSRWINESVNQWISDWVN